MESEPQPTRSACLDESANQRRLSELGLFSWPAKTDKWMGDQLALDFYPTLPRIVIINLTRYTRYVQIILKGISIMYGRFFIAFTQSII